MRDDYDEDTNEMQVSASHCSRFNGRSDVSMFNMMDYQSCENCRHMTADNRCILNMENRFPSMR